MVLLSHVVKDFFIISSSEPIINNANKNFVSLPSGLALIECYPQFYQLGRLETLTVVRKT